MRERSSASRIRTVGRLVVMQQTTLPSPFGPIRLHADAVGLRELAFVADAEPSAAPPSGLLAEAADQLEAYFAGERTAFDLPLAPVGTKFHERVWALVSAIGHGETATYGELAARLGAPTAARAVGAANGRNPIAIVIPCHRVVGARGALTGYAYGIDRKAGLLALERGARPLPALV
jgi:methylated-DNA-[protein]-cysteine S-methyltransferase